jgi:hypothetical protein
MAEGVLPLYRSRGAEGPNLSGRLGRHVLIHEASTTATWNKLVERGSMARLWGEVTLCADQRGSEVTSSSGAAASPRIIAISLSPESLGIRVGKCARVASAVRIERQLLASAGAVVRGKALKGAPAGYGVPTAGCEPLRAGRGGA